MATTILVRNALWRVSNLLSDTAPQFSRWSERELVQWWNDAQMAIVKYLPLAGHRIDAIKLAPGTRQYIGNIATTDVKPTVGSAPAAAIRGRQVLSPRRNMGDDGETVGRAIRLVERDVLDAQNLDWHLETGRAVLEACYDPATPRYFSVWPGVPDDRDVWIELAYAADPIDVPAGGAPGSELYAFAGSSTAVIGIDDQYLEEAVDYTVARANLKDSKYAEPQMAAYHSARFLQALNAKVAAVTGTSPNLTVLPGVTQRGANA